MLVFMLIVVSGLCLYGLWVGSYLLSDRYTLAERLRKLLRYEL